MLKGCQRKVIVVKNPGSELFEEAYFVVKPLEKQRGERDFLAEANRIISSRVASSYGGMYGKNAASRGRASRFFWHRAVVWLFGFAAGAGSLAGTLALLGVFSAA